MFLTVSILLPVKTEKTTLSISIDIEFGVVAIISSISIDFFWKNKGHNIFNNTNDCIHLVITRLILIVLKHHLKY